MHFTHDVEFACTALLFLSREPGWTKSQLLDVGANFRLSPRRAARVLEALAEAGMLTRTDAPSGFGVGENVSDIQLNKIFDALRSPAPPLSCAAAPQRLCRAYRDVWMIEHALGEHMRGLTIGWALRHSRDWLREAPGACQHKQKRCSQGRVAPLCRDAEREARQGAVTHCCDTIGERSVAALAQLSSTPVLSNSYAASVAH